MISFYCRERKPITDALEMLEQVTAALDACVLHFGGQMTISDRRSRTELVHDAEQLIASLNPPKVNKRFASQLIYITDGRMTGRPYKLVVLDHAATKHLSKYNGLTYHWYRPAQDFANELKAGIVK